MPIGLGISLSVAFLLTIVAARGLGDADEKMLNLMQGNHGVQELGREEATMGSMSSERRGGVIMSQRPGRRIGSIPEHSL
jgi:hypothetical protein